MNITLASINQIKIIIEHDSDCPTNLLYQIYEESVKRDMYQTFILGCILKYFRTTMRAERLTKITVDELKWLCYEKGFEALEVFNPGNRPFIAVWSHFIKRAFHEVKRTNEAKKRTAELIDIDDMIIEVSDGRNTEKTAISRLYINSLFELMTDAEKQIAIKRYQGYTLDEIAAIQGVSKSGIQKRISTYVGRLKEAY